MVDMVFLVLIGFLYPPPAWKIFLCGRKSSPNDFFRWWSCSLLSSLKKDPQSQKITQTAPQNYVNNSRGLPVITQFNNGFEANRTRKFTQMFSKILVKQFLCIPNRLLALSTRIHWVCSAFALIAVSARCRTASKHCNRSKRERAPWFCKLISKPWLEIPDQAKDKKEWIK